MTQAMTGRVADVHRAYRGDLDHRQRATLLAWSAFTGTFATVRAITYSIRGNLGRFRNLSIGGEHLHHYMWGIGLVSGVGAVAISGADRATRHPVLAVAYGSGLALIVDEFALLLDLKDVYWARQGRLSVDLAVGAIALTGTALAAAPLRRYVRARRAGRGSRLIPPSAVLPAHR